MQDRTSSLLVIRPNIDTIDKSLKTKDIEAFQNNVLRPILKFQNDLLLQIFIDYANQYKGVFHVNDVMMYVFYGTGADDPTTFFERGLATGKAAINKYFPNEN